jgi:hypothetical protein
MERTVLWEDDTEQNWHTNTGILVAGTDSDGERLAATARFPNAPSMEELEEIALFWQVTVVDTTIVEVQLSGLPTGPGTPEYAVRLPEGLFVSGAGGTALGVGFDLSQESGDLELVLPISGLLMGAGPSQIQAWVITTEQEAVLIPLLVIIRAP